MAEEPLTTASLIVKMVSGLSTEEQAAVIAANGGTEKSSIPALRLHIVEVPASELSTIIQNYQNDPRVVSVEENKERKAEGEPSDTDYLSQWALPKIGWDQVFGTITPTGSATVAVLDTGVDASHVELTGKLITCASILYGSDCTSDPNGHGTWLAGIVAANTDNKNGIAGVGYSGVNIMPVTVMNAEGIGQDSDIIAGVIWAVENGADVILMGFSNPGFSQNLQDAIDYAWENNVVLVAATGNDGISDPTFPAGDRGVIGVSATDQSDNFVSFSNYGQDVFLAAPGIDIETTDIGNSYTSVSGTSSSAAIVSGVAAFMRAVDPTVSNGVIVGRLARNADPAGTVEETGNGRVNMARALADTSLEEIQPAGAEPVGDGGPYVGPYKIAGNVDGAPLSIRESTCNTEQSTFNLGDTVCASTTISVNPSNQTADFRIIWVNPSNAEKWTATFTGQAHNSTHTDSRTPDASGTWTVRTYKGSTGAALLDTKTFTVTTCTAPSITSQPSSATKVVGELVTFSVTASGTAPLSYQWRKGGGNISGETSSSYTINSVVMSDAGSYDVVVTNSCDSATSNAATLTVDKASSTTTVTCGAGPFTYDGSAQTPCSATVTGAGGLSQSLTVNYSNNTNAGTATASATFAGDSNHTGSTDSKNFTIDKASSTTTVTCGAGPFTYDGSAQTPCSATVTGAGGLSLTPTPTYANNTNAGTASASYTYAGDANHDGSSDSKNFTIDKADQTITFDALPDITVDDPDFDVSAKAWATSGLSVSFSSGTPEVCTVESGSTVHLVRTNSVGTCTIQASQDGNDNYKAAPPVDQSFNVAPGVAVAFSVVASQSGSPISSVTAGDSFDVTVTAKDQYNNTAIGYTGKVLFSSNDGKAVLPPDSMFDSGDNGSKTFSSVVLKTSGAHQWVRATDNDSSIEGTTQDINVGPASANTFMVDTPASATAGAAFDVTITVQDAYGNTVTYYTGTVHFTSSDANPSVELPNVLDGYQFTTGVGEDNGVHTFHETTLITAPIQTIKVTDGSITVESVDITVNPGALDHFTFANISSPQTALNPFSVTITAEDKYENTVTSFTGTVDLTITVGSSISPATTGIFAIGIWTDSVTISGAGSGRTVTAKDSVSGKTGTSNSFDVNKAAATVTLSNMTQTYTGSALTPTATTAPGVYTIVWTGAPQTNAGSYEVTATVDDPNYEGSASGTFKINKASSTTTVTVAGGTSFTYDGNAHPATVSVTGAGGLNLTPDPVYSCGHAPISAADSGCTASYTFAGDANHDGSSDSKTYTINKADPVVTATGNICTYNGSPCAGSGSATGVKGENLTPVNIAYKDALGNLLTSAPVNAGTYQVAARYAGDANYNQKQSAAATITINKASSTTTVTVAGGTSFTYDGNTHPATVSVTGVGGLSLAPDPVYSCGHTPINVVDSGCVASYTFAGDDNHYGSSDSKTYTISKADPVVTATGNTCTYNGSPCTGSGSATGVKGETLTPVNVAYKDTLGNLLTLAPVNAGSYQVAARYAGDANYNQKQSAAVPLTIEKADSLTVVMVAGGESFTYDGNAHPATVSVTGVGGLNLSPDPVYSCGHAPKDFADSGCTASYAYAGDDNHKPSSNSKTYTISKAPSTTVVTVAGGVSFTYDGNAHPATVSVTGVGGLNLSPDPVYSCGHAPKDFADSGCTASYTYAGDANHNGSSDSKTYTITKASSTTTLLGTGSFTYDGNPHAATATVTGAGGLNLPVSVVYSGNCSSAPVNVNDTLCTVTATYAGDANHNGSNATGTITITQASTTTTAMVSAASVRYKDMVTLTAKVVPLNTASLLDGNVAFQIGSVSYGSASVVPIPGDLQGAVQATVIVQVSELPGSYTVTATFTSTNPNYSGSIRTVPLTVVPREAAPYNGTGFYTGDLFAWTTGQSSSTATVTLTAMIKDANDPTGDVRGARVTFYFVNGSTLTPISSAKDLPVGLVDVTDGTVGTASAIVQLNIGSANAQSFRIAVGISGGYKNNPWEALSQTIVTVAKPIPGGQIVGGGTLTNTAASAGLIKGAVGQFTNFQFDVQYNKKQINPQGKVEATIRSYYKPDGTLDSRLHTYLITSNAISLLNVQPPTATFSSKANLLEQLPDGSTVAIEGGSILQLSMNGNTKTLAITLQRKAGGLWFSSNWNPATGKAVEQAISGGTISVK